MSNLSLSGNCTLWGGDDERDTFRGWPPTVQNFKLLNCSHNKRILEHIHGSAAIYQTHIQGWHLRRFLTETWKSMLEMLVMQQNALKICSIWLIPKECYYNFAWHPIAIMKSFSYIIQWHQQGWKKQFKPMSPYLSPLSLSLPCQATTLWGHKMGLREWGGNCGWRAMEYDKKEETWWTGRSREEGDSRELWLLRLVSFLCRHYAHLRRPWEGKNKK